MLFDIEIDGVMRKALAQPGKTGWVYLLDRESGEPLLGIEERPVPQEPRQATSPTQPFPVGDAFVPQSMSIAPEGYPLVNKGRIFTSFWTDPIVAKPGQGGGANWPASSYDLRTGYLYVCASDRTGIFRGGDRDFDVAPDGDPYLGGAFGTVPFGVTGIFAALDMRTNRLVWQQEWPERCYSGSVATAGGLVFVGRSDGRLTALDSSTGALLWAFQTGAGVNAPVSVFEQDGQQYVVVLSAGNLFAGSRHGDSVWLFSLNGEIGPVEPADQDAASAAVVSPVADLDVGRAVYQNACSACHGRSGEGGHGGDPALTAATNRSAIMQMVRNGRNDMPAFGRVLSPEQIRDVSAHVVETLPR